MIRIPLLHLLICLTLPVLSQNTEIRYLSGTGMDDKVNWEFHIDKGMNSGEWTTIPVPSNWELEGFGVYNYGRGDNAPSDETAQYRRRFDVPEEWEGRTVSIVFEGVMTDTRVEINGQPAGPVHQGGFYRFKYDISRLLIYGDTNQLDVTVKNWSENASVNEAERKADYWIFGGIFRPVYLEVKPQEHIDRIAINAKADGSFTMQTYLNNHTRANRLEARIVTFDGQPAGEIFSCPVGPDSSLVELSAQISDPRLWSPEFPNRYRVQVRLKQDEYILHQTMETFGFRTVELRPQDGIYVNGAKVVFKGVNRHSFWPESGRTTNRELSIRDVELMKEMNMNAVRMSHYPPDKHFLEICDSLGLFVLNELAGWQAAYDTEVGRKLVRELVIRDVNHPCIVIWDNGNEGGFNPELDDDFHRYDPQKRPVIHPWTTFRHTDTQHYVSYDCCAGAGFHSKEIFFPTELLHGLYDGGHGAGLEDYWDRMCRMPNGAGAFLWVFADEGVIRTDQNGTIDTWQNNAPDGILGPYREKEGSFYTIREIWNPIYVEGPASMAFFDGTLKVENRFLYTDLDQCSIKWSLLRFPGPFDAEQHEFIVDSGFVATFPLPPGGRSALNVDLPADWKEADALAIRTFDARGRETFSYRFPLKQPAEVVQGIIPEEGAPVTLREDENSFFLGSGTNEITIDRRTGLISQISHEGRHISLIGGPRTDLQLGLFRIKDIQTETDEQGNSLTVYFEGINQGDMPGLDWELQYTMLPGGWLRMEYQYLPKKGDYDFLGVNFDYPEENVEGIRYLGRGPYRVWKNRMKGPQLGLWQKNYNNTVTGESLWQYPEFKGYHADLYWAALDTKEGEIIIATETEGLFFRLYTPPPPQGAFNDHTSGVFPGGDISILHAISPIGTKFKKAEELGPMSQKNMVDYNRNREPFRGVVYLNFR